MQLMEFQCQKCKNIFNPTVISYKIKGGRRIIKCPYCNKRYENILSNNEDYIIIGKSQLIHKYPVKRMKKKERLKLRKEFIEGSK